MLISLNYRVLVKPVEIDEVDPAYKAAKAMGIEIVESERNREQMAVDRGVVVNIGPDAPLAKGLEVGDEVFYARYAGKKVVDPYTKIEYLGLNDEDLLIKIVKE